MPQKDSISAGFGTEYLGGASNEVRIRQPGKKLKGTEASKPPEWLAAHPDTGRYPNHVLVDIQPASSDTVDLIYEAIPTTPKIEESIDAELGIVKKYTYRNKYGATLPTIGATTIESTTLTSGDYVHRSAENLIGGVMAEVTVTVVTPASAPVRDKTEISDIWGSYTVYEKFVRNADVTLLAKNAGSPYGSGPVVLNDELVDTDGTFGTRRTTVITLANCTVRDKRDKSDIYGEYIVYEKFVLSSTSTVAKNTADPYGAASFVVLNDEVIDQDGTFGTRRTTCINLSNCPERDSKTTDKDFATAYMYEQFVLQSGASFLAIGGTKGSYKVRSCRLKDQDGTFATLETIAVDPSTGIIKTSKITDKDYGYVYQYEQWGLSSRSLNAIGSSYGIGTVLDARITDDDGYFSNLQLTVLPSQTGTQKKNQDIDKIFCVSKVIVKKVPSSTTIPERGSSYSYTGGTGYVLDASLRDDDGTNANLEIKLTTSNQATFREYKLDGETGKIYTETTTYQLGGTQPIGQAVNQNAEYVETKRIDCNFYVSTASKTTTLTTESIPLVVSARWPAVLLSFSINPLYDNNDKVAKYMVDYELKKQYVGHCRAIETRSWSATAPSVANVVTLIEESVVYQGIFINFVIPSCLHYSIAITENTGTGHPLYRYTTRSKFFSQTPYIAWPSSMIVESNVSRYKGGYLKETLTVYAPS